MSFLFFHKCSDLSSTLKEADSGVGGYFLLLFFFLRWISKVDVMLKLFGWRMHMSHLQLEVRIGSGEGMNAWKAWNVQHK